MSPPDYWKRLGTRSIRSRYLSTTHRTWPVNPEADAAIGHVRSDGHHIAPMYLIHVVGSGRAFSARSEGRS